MTSDSLPGTAEGNSSAADRTAVCKRPGCGKPVPATPRGRTRQFCSNECARRYHNDARIPARRQPSAAEAAEAADPLSALEVLLRQALSHLRAAREQALASDLAELRARLAEADALRRRAEADAAEAAAALAAAREEIIAARAEADAAEATAALAAAREEIIATRADSKRDVRERDTPPPRS